MSRPRRREADSSVTTRRALLLTWRELVPAIAIGIALYAVIAVTSQQNAIQADREARIAAQNAANRAICRELRTVEDRLIDTKRKQINGTKASIANTARLSTLIEAVVSPDRPPPSDKRLVRVFRREAAASRVQIRAQYASIRDLRTGIGILKRERESRACNDLPTDKPFNSQEP